MKSKYLALIVSICCFFGISSLHAQSVISLDDAIQIGLERNFGILIAENEAEIDRLNRTLGNAGFLPSLDVIGSREEIFESETNRIDGETQVRDDVEISLLSADVELGWTLFDGFRMFVAYERLGELEALGETLARVRIENTIRDLIEAYYEVVQQEKFLGVLRNSVEISEERVSIALTKEELGSGSEYELLLAQSDLNADRAEMIRQEVVLNDTKINLIRLLDLESNEQFDVDETISMTETMNLDDLLPLFAENNREMEAARLQSSVSELEIRELRRERYPRLDLNMGYTWNREEVRNNLLLLDRTDGFYVGVTARINLFDGFNTNRRVQTAKINHRNDQIRQREEEKFLETALYSEYERYSRALDLVDLENENLNLAEQALEIALEQFRLATITSIELRETQNIFFDTENRLIEAQFEAKISETELMRLAGILGSDYNF